MGGKACMRVGGSEEDGSAWGQIEIEYWSIEGRGSRKCELQSKGGIDGLTEQVKRLNLKQDV